MNKHTIVTDKQENVDILHRDGKPLFCPYRIPLAIPGKMAGTQQIVRDPCGNWCPHFNQINAQVVRLSCGSENEIFVETEKKKMIL